MPFVGRFLLFVVVVAVAVTALILFLAWLLKWLSYRPAAKTYKWQEDQEAKAKADANKILKNKNKRG